LLVTFLIKEEMALIGLGFAAYALLGKRDWKVGLGVLVSSLLAFATLMQVVIPFLAGGHSYPYIGERYADVGVSPRGILTTLVTDPLRVARGVLQPKKIYFVIGIFGPTFGLSAPHTTGRGNCNSWLGAPLRITTATCNGGSNWKFAGFQLGIRGHAVFAKVRPKPIFDRIAVRNLPAADGSDFA
jgi:hypothetical protein